MEVEVKTAQGQVSGVIEVSDYVWAEPMHEALLHQVVVAQRANQRQGTHATKRRWQITASGRKLRTQKHTGRARLGSRSSPSLRGGAVAHGPHPRSHRQRIPTKMRRRALRIALSEQLRRGRIVVLDELKIDDPKTKPVLALLESLGATDGVLIVTAGTDRVAMKSANNLQGVSVLAAPLLNPLRAVGARNIIITRDAVRRVDEIWAEPQSRPARKLAAA